MPLLSRFDRIYAWFLCALVALGSWWWNHDFGPWTRPDHLATMNDVPDILRGFAATPNFWRDSWSWWHGPWIQQGIQAYRPLSSIFLWLECWVGTHYGFQWIAGFGIVLLAALSWQCVCLAREFTGSRGAMLVAALVAPVAHFWLMGGSAPFYWLAWFAGHHDLIMISALLGALLWWTRWLQSGQKRELAWSLGLFVVGVLCKEFVYIFPAMAVSVALFHPGRRVALRTALLWSGSMFAFLALAWILRAHFLPHAYNPPPLKTVHFIRRPFLYWFPSFYKYVPSLDFFPAVLALWLFVSVGAALRWKQKLTRPFHWMMWGLGVFVGALLIAQYFIGMGEGFWYFVEGPGGALHRSDMAEMLFTLWGLWAIWKYRRETPSLAILGVFLLAYVPVWTYLGWHYTLAGWFVRAGLWWPLLYTLARRDWLKWPALERPLRSRFGGAVDPVLTTLPSSL